MKIDFEKKTVLLPETPKRIKKITGTRFAAILGLNPWCTPFEVWCDMTGTFKIPFEDSVYTKAGKLIEPRVIDYLDRHYHYGRKLLKGPDEWFGRTKEQMHYDHFPENKVFGGMWDCRTDDIVYELKTTKRVEDWYKSGRPDAPVYYKLQGALYAYLLGLDRFRMVLTALNPEDYEQPENFVPTPENTNVLDYRVSDEFPQFASHIETCEKWLEQTIQTPVSPQWSGGKNDAEIIRALTTSHAVPLADGQADPVSALVAEIEPLQAEIDDVTEQIEEKEKRLKKLKEQLRPALQKRMKESDKKLVFDGVLYSFEVSRSPASDADTERLKSDGLYDTYKKSGFTYKLNVNRRSSK